MLAPPWIPNVQLPDEPLLAELVFFVVVVAANADAAVNMTSATATAIFHVFISSSYGEFPLGEAVSRCGSVCPTVE